MNTRLLLIIGGVGLLGFAAWSHRRATAATVARPTEQAAGLGDYSTGLKDKLGATTVRVIEAARNVAGQTGGSVSTGPLVPRAAVSEFEPAAVAGPARMGASPVASQAPSLEYNPVSTGGAATGKKYAMDAPVVSQAAPTPVAAVAPVSAERHMIGAIVSSRSLRGASY